VCSEHGAGASEVARVFPRPVSDVEVSAIPLEPVDAVSITTLVDNNVDMLLLDEGPARRVGVAGSGGPSSGEIPTEPCRILEGGRAIAGLSAEHGFSALVTITKAGRDRTLLFDAGVSPHGMVANMTGLGIDPAEVEIVVLSHGHFDHTTGLDGFAERVKRPNLPVVVHPEIWTRRRIAIPGRDPFEIPSPSRAALESVGFAVVEEEQPSLLVDSSILITGQVDRTTGFESGFAFHEAKRQGRWVPDPLIVDDQSLIVDVAGRGLVVLTGCGHAGLVNIARFAQRLTGVGSIHALLGGFHLSGPLFEPIIEPTCAALEEMRPDVVVPAHCTGFAAARSIAARLPDAFIQNSVGTRYEFGRAA
jgi:7,8-dihydropterin-6-yl-methyl-4-(beta-D-ribofuranosyl)aminobenzene 5'-phosphate synthase